jgi:hypothetical protein
VVSLARPAARGWLIGAAVVVVLGTLVRLIVAGTSVPRLSGTVLAVLLWLGVWLAMVLLTNPRVAFFVGLAAMAVVDVSAFPPRVSVSFDDREVLYRTDQSLAVHVSAVVGDTLLTVLAEPVFAGAQPRFGLAGQVGGTAVEWSCTWRRGRQVVALPLPASATGGFDVQLRLIGTPSRDGDYLLVYASSAQPGPVILTTSPSALKDDATMCALR